MSAAESLQQTVMQVLCWLQNLEQKRHWLRDLPVTLGSIGAGMEAVNRIIAAIRKCGSLVFFFSRREIRGEVTKKKKKLCFCCPRRLPTSAPNHALLTVWSPPRRFKLKQEILHQRKCHFNSQANVDNNLQTTQQSRSKPVSRCYVQNVHQSCRAMPQCW